MNKIATHDSVTGEKGSGLLSFLLTPFSRTLSKTIKEQYNVGCRFFDIRIRKTKNKWICTHGLWTAKKSADDILNEINNFGDCFVLITYEGLDKYGLFEEYVKYIMNKYEHIKITTVNIKLPKWTTILAVYDIAVNGAFIHLDYSSWHTYIPIPWLWKKIYYNNPVFTDKYFKMVDFL